MYIFTASQADCDHCVANVTTDLLSTWYLPQTKGDWEGKCDCPRCLSVSKITQKRVHGFGWNVACRQISGHGRTDQLLSPIRIIVQMPEPDCFLRYRMRCNTEFYLLGKITCRYWAPVTAVRCGFKWFYSPRAVGTPLSEVNALYRWEHLCRRYMRSTECLSSLWWFIMFVHCVQKMNKNKKKFNLFLCCYNQLFGSYFV